LRRGIKCILSKRLVRNVEERRGERKKERKGKIQRLCELKRSVMVSGDRDEGMGERKT